MHPAQTFCCRVFQTAFRLALPVLPYREPRRLKTIDELVPLFDELRIDSILLVTDAGLRSCGVTRPLEEMLARAGICCAVYDQTCANPTDDNVEAARLLYQKHRCQALIAMGGGSSIDCAKAIGARITYPKKNLAQLKGLLHVLRRIPTLIAIPTTAGTGSEVTVAAVITDSQTRHKYVINSFPLIPHYAVLDPQVTFSLPPHLTATTGMDALTHAVEAYIGRSTSKKTRATALKAAALIFENLETAYQDGRNAQARANMLKASYLAGVAFTQSYVGYVHAVAHSLGGRYNVPHGLANAVLLPIVLRHYEKHGGKRFLQKMRALGIAVGVASAQDSPAQAAGKCIAAIESLNQHLNIPAKLSGIRVEDIPEMARHAAREANPLYPVPVEMNARELQIFYHQAADWSPTHA